MNKVKARAWESFRKRLEQLNRIVELGPDVAFLTAQQIHMLRESFALFAPDEYFGALQSREEHRLREHFGFCGTPDCENEKHENGPYCEKCEAETKVEMARLDLAEALSNSTRAKS